MLALLPLDDRPCNTRFPTEIAAIGADDLILPPRPALGRFNRAGDFSALRDWLFALPEVSALILSVDMLAYGGLVAARRTHTSLETALKHLEIVREWRASRPDVPVYGFNILMRLAITMDSDAAVPHYYNIMRWAGLVDEAARFPSNEKTAELARLESQIPSEIMAEYLGARARNHAVNLRMIEWLGQGVFDFLLVTQEDCTEFGLHRREQAELLEKVADLGVADKFNLHPGADEAALTLLARHWQTATQFQIHWSSEARKREIAVFEDVPYQDALDSHICAMGGGISEGENSIQLFVNAPVGGSQRAESAESQNARREELKPFINELQKSLRAGKQVALCDVAFPNGADNVLMEAIFALDEPLAAKLLAFGGWNTAGNTTGTVLAQCAATQRAQKLGKSAQSAPKNRRFVFERLLDYWYYQANVRAKLEKLAREEGFSPLSMNGHTAGVEAMAREEMSEMAERIAREQFGAKLREIQVNLPWGRTFEVEIGAKLG